ncbi:MAG: hypothetical protein GXY13_02675 [Acidimicrobiales bacterium]|nr:hypothetical protein [Acidimicrobiales bacterium]
MSLGTTASGGGPVIALRPLGVGEALDAALKVYRARARDMIVATALVTVPAIVLQVLVQISAGDPQQVTGTDEVTGLPTIDGTAFATYLGGLLVSTLLVVVANNLALAGTTRLSLGAYLGDRPGWGASLRFAWRRIVPLTAVLVVTTVGMLAGLVLCIAPALWLQGIWAVAVPVLLTEDRGAIDSLRRSQELVRGRFWPVLGTILAGGLLASVLQGVLVGPTLILTFVGASFLVTSILTGLAQIVGVALTTPFVAALTAVVYVDLRVRKEGFDLELLARGVGVDPGVETAPSGPTGPVTALANPPVPARPDAGPVAPPGGWGAPAPSPSGPRAVPATPTAEADGSGG